MSEPIRSRGNSYKRTGIEKRDFSYEELIELFPDGDGSVVNPLVRRCQDLEQQNADNVAEIARLTQLLAAVTKKRDALKAENEWLRAELEE